ncbi:protein white-like [Bacillus rossius redtenbacheri]|uniref:protein white-like n=1 Tax=Bacillus rossius redtenbacheri TaxID=93214 RepID=UPI002FDCEC90
MTASDECETAPLLAAAIPPTAKRGKPPPRYHAVIEERRTPSISDDYASDVSVPMEPLHNGVRLENGYSSGGGGGGGGGRLDPRGGRVVDSITYTWHDMNVFTEGGQPRRRRLFPGVSPSSHESRHMKHIIKGVSGVARPGELMAIMGSSGAGKTTLLNTLMFRSGSNMVVSGYRAFNEVPVSSSAMASLSAYVQQDDLFFGTLTVREHLVFQALVRMDRHIPYKQRMTRVDQVISELALAKCQNTTIGIPGRIRGISGGEMKRLSFASEVLTNPPLMFCDEPTSGLDAFMAQNVVSVLKSMAQKGKTVVCTIHQPSSEVFALFDKVLLMAEGRVAFLGSAAEACLFFRKLGAACPTNYNPADFFIQLLAVIPSREDACKETIELICDNFQASDIGANLHDVTRPKLYQMKELMNGGGIYPEAEVAQRRRSPYKASWWAQMRAVLWRSWLCAMKEPILIKVRILQTVMVALVIGLVYFNQKMDQDGVMNINGALFLFLTNMTFQNLFAVINVFCSEMPVFLREHHNGMYRTDVYFVCKSLAEVPVFVAIPVIFTAVAYFMVGLNPAPGRIYVALAVMTLIANVATSFGYLVSCMSGTVGMALTIGPPVIIPFMLFGGFFLNNESVPPYFRWLSYLSWFRYGNEALLVNQWTDIDHIACTERNATCPKNGEVVLEALNFCPKDFKTDILSLVGLIFLFRLLAYLSLLARTSRGH